MSSFNQHKKVFSVYELNNYLKALIEEDVILNGIFIEGEISNFKHHTSGHVYFTLKDKFSVINCIMFKSFYEKNKFELRNGLNIIAFGNISTYEKNSQYQLYVNFLQTIGKGDLFLEFEQLKQKLQQAGLFNQEYKKSIPKKTTCVAVITSPTGAAVRDIINVCKRRNKNIQIVIIPTIVQGNDAPFSIVNSIKIANEWNGCDLIILGRGGGSIEDLWAFNNEIVAKEIFKSKIPIISAIGHETDFTISDFVSDLRAATPSVAAELAIFKLDDEIEYLKNLKKILHESLINKFIFIKNNYEKINKKIIFDKMIDKLIDEKNFLYELNYNLLKTIEQKIYYKKILLNNKIEVLEKVSPISILKKGFAIAKKDNKLLKSIRNLKVSDILDIELLDGIVEVEVKKINNFIDR